jgi:hypothetical protein
VELPKLSSTLTLKATIEFSSVDPSSIGLMLRAQDTANSDHVQLRMDGIGDIVRFVYRNQGVSNYIDKPNISVPQIAETVGQLPRKLSVMLVKTGNTVKGYYLDGADYIQFGETTVNFTGTTILAGVGLYTGIGGSTGVRIPEAKAIISNLSVVSNY